MKKKRVDGSEQCRTPGKLIKGLLPEAIPEIDSLINAGAITAITQTLGLKDQEQN